MKLQTFVVLQIGKRGEREMYVPSKLDNCIALREVHIYRAAPKKPPVWPQVATPRGNPSDP
jgi:hypothetical protein